LQRGQNHAIVSLDQCEGIQSGDVLRKSNPLRAAFLDLKLYEEKGRNRENYKERTWIWELSSGGVG